MREKILEILMYHTDYERRYIGGGDEPTIIVFDNSEDCSKERYLKSIAEEIATELENM